MIFETTDLLRCRQLIEHRLDWGASARWTSADFSQLQRRLLEQTGVLLSVSTLRRVWGREAYGHKPSDTTLNTLAQFAGYADWRQFTHPSREDALLEKSVDAAQVPPPERGNSWRRLGWIAGIISLSLVISLVGLTYQRRRLAATAFGFSGKILTRGVPNSVVFNYDASSSPTDSLFIQQSWDSRRRSLVRKNDHTHTSIYYEPGFYRAKLVVGQQVVKEQPLLIPTNGWLATIATKPIPIYLKPEQFRVSNRLHVPGETLKQYPIAGQPAPPWVHYFTVGTFRPVPLTNFAFESTVKNEYSDGAGACQLCRIVLITTGMPINIPLSAKGCVSELMLRDSSQQLLGRDTDLSAFGVDFMNWIQVSCRSEGQTLCIRLNNKLVYTTRLPMQDERIVGIAYGFLGTGSVKGIRLRSGRNDVFRAF